MAEQPKVSVTIPSYNHARFLPATIESVLAQTYPQLELIIVDDGSTDGSLQIAAEYAARYPQRIKVFTHPGHANRGISATVNLCFEKTTGVYWMGLPSDDQLHPLKVAEQVAFLEAHPRIGWVYGHAYYIDEQDRPRPEFGLFGEDITRTPDPVERLIEANAIPGMTALMRRAAVAEIAPHDETLVYSDWDFWVRLGARHAFAFLPRARVRYRIHSYNTSVGRERAVNMQRAIEVMQKLQREAERTRGALARPRTQALLALQLAYFNYAAQAEAQARRHLHAAFSADPTLGADAPYFIRWLKDRYRQLVLMYDRPPEISFGAWGLANLPAGCTRQFVQAVGRAVAGPQFGPHAAWRFRCEAYWRGRRAVLRSLLCDPRARAERELFNLHLEAFIGTRIGRHLRRLPRPHAVNR